VFFAAKWHHGKRRAVVKSFHGNYKRRPYGGSVGFNRTQPRYNYADIMRVDMTAQ